jgi:sigma-B regulation protein RsbU (phosphoserine phosphatase)
MTTANARILVVDDVAENRDLLVRRLKRLGITAIDQATNGHEALAAIGAASYDLVLLDIMMPELDGFGVLEKLRQDGRINDLPVVVISALNEIEPVVRCVELGAEDFIFKPFNPVLLRARVLASLEKKALRDQTREELRRKRAELNEARTLQLSLVPPRFEGTLAGCRLSIDVMLEPAKEVGGDLVDHFPIGDDLVALLIGDVSDKGAGAALVMARTHSMFRSLAARPDAEALFREPVKAVGIVNDALSVGNDSCMFVTLLLACLDLKTRQLSYVRAGHIPPFHRNAAGTIARLGTMGGPPLGLIEGTSYKTGSAALADDDRVLILTDGFTEAGDAAGELYGEARIETFLAGSGAGDDPITRLFADVKAHEAGLPQADDMAAILLTLGAPTDR